MQYKYFTCGSQKEKEGLTLAVNTYDDAGNFVAGIEDIENKFYKVTEITKAEYDAYLAQVRANGMGGLFGIVDSAGKQAVDDYMAEEEREKEEAEEAASPPLTTEQIAVAVNLINHLISTNVLTSSTVIEFLTLFSFSSEHAQQIQDALSGNTP